jgi:hypothetical protein
MEPNNLLTVCPEALATVTGANGAAGNAFSFRGAYDLLAGQANEQQLYPGRYPGSSAWFKDGNRYVSGSVGSAQMTCWRNLKGESVYGCSTAK